MRPRNSNTKRLRSLVQPRHVIRNRSINPANVERIISRNRLQHRSRIAHARSQWPNMIQRPRQRNHTSRRYAPISRLDPNAPAQRRGFANRACSVGPNRRVAKSRSNRGRRPSRRSPSDMPRVPRIVNVAEKADQRTAAISKLMQIVLSQNHRARLPQPPHHLRIFGGHAILVKRAGSGCTRARGIDQVLQCDRNAVQRPAPFPARNLNFRSPRLRQRRFSTSP